MTVPRGIDKTVWNSYLESISNDVRDKASALKTTLSTQQGSRNSAVTTASTDFAGYFSQLFTQNATIQKNESANLRDSLNKVITGIADLQESARQEQARIDRAKEWQAEHDKWERTKGEWTWEGLCAWWNGEPEIDTADATPGEQLKISIPEVSHSNHDVPAPATVAGSTSISSARPENLDQFVSLTSPLNTDLTTAITDLSNAFTTFNAAWKWGSMDLTSLISVCGKHKDANVNDCTWVSQISAAFKQAGESGTVVSMQDAALYAALQSAGVDASRTELDIPAVEILGDVPTTGYALDPVNTATGNFIEPETDLAFGDLAASLTMTRMYNSVSAVDSVFGPGWSSLLDSAVHLDAEGANWQLGDGRQIFFPRSGRGWSRAERSNYWLAYEPAASFPLLTADEPVGEQILVVRDNSGSWWAFTAGGRWLGQGTGPGTTIRIVRNADGMISGLTHEYGRGFTIEYCQGRVAYLTANDGRRVDYAYDEAGRLRAVTTEVGTRNYRYDEAGRLNTVVSAAGVVEVENTYDDHGRVRWQRTAHGRMVRFAYLAGRITVVSDENGERSNTWIADRFGRVIGVVDSADQRQSMTYDAHGNLIQVTARDGATTVHAYDERGRRVHTVLPSGGEFTYGWDRADRVTTVVNDAGSVVSYEYGDSAQRNPSAVIDPLGGRTELTWHGGLLDRIVDPTGVSMDFVYNDLGELVATTNAEGGVSQLVRDQVGRVVKAITPMGFQTTFTYGPKGELLSRKAPDGGIWHYEYGLGGRVTAVVDPMGGRTEMEYNPSGEVFRTVDPLGRTIERSFDDLGNVTGLTLPDGAEWQFAHDSLSRLRTITSPEGGLWSRHYSDDGDLDRLVDPGGVVTELETTPDGSRTVVDRGGHRGTIDFDPLGRPRTVTNAASDSDIVTYNAAGDPVEILDGEGGLTVLRRDIGGRVIEQVSPEGRSTAYGYDSCGRLSSITDADSQVTRFSYDADSRLVARTSPTGESATFRYDESGRLVESVQPGRGRSVIRYDKCGRIVFHQDSWLGIRRFSYDAAGQLVAVSNGIGATTHYEYDQRGRMVTITNPEGGCTTRVYNDLDKVISLTDPLGRTTTATYDQAGRQLSQTTPEGIELTFGYDASGERTEVRADGRLLSRVERDLVNRTVKMIDHTRADQQVTHELAYDRCRRLIARRRGDQSVTFTYDRDGLLTSRTTPAGITTTFTRDSRGQVTEVSNPLTGSATFGYDQAGRLVSARNGRGEQNWFYTGGELTKHSTEDFHTSLINRDAWGRITSIGTDEGATTYAYDQACQLIEARTTGGQVSSWTYDQLGRVTSATAAGDTTRFVYDAASQLVEKVSDEGRHTCFSYDATGRRVSQETDDGSVTRYEWSPLNWLTDMVTTDPEGGESHTRLWTDALGELARIDDQDLWWDTGSLVPNLVEFGARQVLNLPGMTGLDDDWLDTRSWRTARPTDPANPWATCRPGTAVSPGGRLSVGGLEAMGARFYDPATTSFLIQDPLQTISGTIWEHNSYNYAGNDPLHALDPLGLKPITDANMAALTEYNNNRETGMAERVFSWETLLGVGLIGLSVFAGALALTGVGAPAALAILALSGAASGAGSSVLSQKLTSGKVNWAEVGKEAIVGAVTGVVGGGTGMAVSKVGGKALTSVVSGAAEGVAGGVASYAMEPGPHTLTGFLYHAGSGAVIGGGTSLAGHAVSELGAAKPTPGIDVSDTRMVYRVEGPGNQRVDISPDGMVELQGDRALYLNFGDEARAQEFLAKRRGQGFDDTQIKAFEVPESYATHVESRAVPQAGNSGQPILRVDPNQTPVSFQFNGRDVIDEVQQHIVPGSGRILG